MPWFSFSFMLTLRLTLKKTRKYVLEIKPVNHNHLYLNNQMKRCKINWEYLIHTENQIPTNDKNHNGKKPRWKY